MPAERVFDPDRVAYFEAHGWRAYYDHNWPGLLRLVVGLCQEQFGIPFPASLLAAYHITRASMAWAPRDHDLPTVQAHYEKFYDLARRYSGLNFDPARAAVLETQYNDVHRRLSGKPDKSEFIETMMALHSVVFGIPLEQARESAQRRVQANNIVDGITSRVSTDIEGDWARLEDELRQCYGSIARHLNGNTLA